MRYLRHCPAGLCQCFNGNAGVDVQAIAGTAEATTEGDGKIGPRSIANALRANKLGFFGKTAIFRSEPATVLRRTLIGQTPVVDLVLAQDYSRYVLGFVIYRSAIFVAGETKTVNVWEDPDEVTLQLSQLRIDEANYRQFEELAKGSVASGTVRILRFRRKEAAGKTLWSSGTAGDGVIYKVDAADVPLLEGKSYYCQLGRESPVGSSLVMIAVQPFLEVGRDFPAEIRELEKQREKQAAA
jgi:hypothetical protein